MRFGLDRMHKLMTVLGLPQRRFASIHVVGTNGKSSTVRFCAAILARHGLRVGSYTSPHLGSFRERIDVGEEPVSEADFAAAVQRAAHAAELVNRTQEPDDGVTQFEALTAASYHELARRGVEVAVIEAGLGGRFDATNVIPSKVQVLTSGGLEHTRWLGPTAIDIAEEELAVGRDPGPLLDGEVEPGLRPGAARGEPARDAPSRTGPPWPSGWRPRAAPRSCRPRRRPRPRCVPPAASSAATSPWPRPPPRRSPAAPSTRTRCSAPRPRRSCPAAPSRWPTRRS